MSFFVITACTMQRTKVTTLIKKNQETLRDEEEVNIDIELGMKRHSKEVQKGLAERRVN